MENLVIGAVIGAVVVAVLAGRLRGPAAKGTGLSPRARIVSLAALVVLASVATVIMRLISSGDLAASLGFVAFATALAITTAAAHTLR